jgi:hypothetical protein
VPELGVDLVEECLVIVEVTSGSAEGGVRCVDFFDFGIGLLVVGGSKKTDEANVVGSNV